MKSLTPYDLTKNLKTVGVQKICVNDLVREAKKGLKMQLVQSKLEVMGYPVSLTTSKTRFNGERIWFTCPSCLNKCAQLYLSARLNKFFCNKCIKQV